MAGAEINKIETEKIQRINKMKSQFFKKTKLINCQRDKPRKKREDPNKLEMKKETL